MTYESIFLFTALFWFSFSNSCYSKTDTLHQGYELKDWDELISSNNVFCLKFFGFGTGVYPYLGIFYRNKQINSPYTDESSIIFKNKQIRYYNRDDSSNTASDDVSNSAVWVANRNNPIRDIYGKLIIDVNGKFSILSGGGTIVDLFNPTLLVTRNASVTLLDTGNLVLQELHPDGSVKGVLWQSFDYPTDTLLPGMKLGINLKTGHRWSLTSWRNDELPAEGLFTLVGDHNRTGQMVILRQGNVHWASGPWQNGEFNNTDLQSSDLDVRFDYVSNEVEQSFIYLTRTYDSYPALRMHQDGQLKSSALNINLHCHSVNDPPGCIEDEFEKLECRKDYRFGLQRKYEYSFYNYVDEYVYDESYNLYDCQRICWSNCSWVAYTTARNRVGCKTYAKRVDYTQAYRQETAERIYYTIDYYGAKKDESSFPSYDYTKDMEKQKKIRIVLIILIGLIIMIVSLAVLISSFWVYKNIDFKVIAERMKKFLLQVFLCYILEIAKKIKKLLLLQMRRMRQFYIYIRTDKNVNTELHYFTFQSISSATNNFSSTNKLGKGGFGEVFKGKLVDGQDVAVKRLSKASGQGGKEFKNETELIAKLQHTNLVRILGYCVEKHEQILVYKYMPNTSLDSFLFDPMKKGLLDWNNRFVIIDGIAQGLLYLHRFSRLRIIHRDLKASNILLDDYLKPKISDFGMAKLFGINESEANTSRVVGTRGYMPPE